VIAKLEQSKADIEQTLNPDSGHLEISVATTTNSFRFKAIELLKGVINHK
jgi:hypothetical protein